MQLGFVSAILPALSFDQVIGFAADEGFDCVELMSWPTGKAERRYAGVTHIDVSNFTAGDARRVNELAGSRGVAISALGYYPNALSPDPADAEHGRRHIEKVIIAAGMLGIG